MAEERAVTDESEEKLIVVTPQPGAVKGGSGSPSPSVSDSIAGSEKVAVVVEQENDSDGVESSQQESEEGTTPEPSRDLLFEINGTRVYISLIVDEHRQRFVPATGIVVPVGVKGGLYGSYAKSLQKELNPDTWKRIESGIKEAASAGIRFDRPVPVALDADIVREVLPNTPLPADNGVGYIIAATAGDAKEPEDLREATEKIVLLAADLHISHLTILPLGTGRGPFKERVRDVASQMVTGIWVAINDLPAGSLNEITLVTRDKDIVTAAQDKARVLTRNRPQAVQNDEPAAEDLIGIRFEAEALAETILLQDTEVPLAVGILGGWGSGKSTVMRLMQKKMTELRIQPVASGWEDDLGQGAFSKHVGHVYQIRFNAWTYAKANLWASLMQTIFTEMNRQLSCEQSLVEINEKLERTPKESGLEYQYLYDEYGWLNPGDWKLLPPEIRKALQSSQVGNRLWKTLNEQQQDALQELKDKQEEIAAVRKALEEQKTKRQQEVSKKLKEKAQQNALAEFERKAAAMLGTTSEEIVKQFVESTSAETGTQVEEILTGMRSIRTSWNQIWRMVKDNWKVAIPIFLACLGLVVGTVVVALLKNWPPVEAYLSTALSIIPLLLVLVRATVPLARRVGELAAEHTLLEGAEIERLLQLRTGEMARLRSEDEESAESIMLDPTLGHQQKLEKLRGLKNNLVAYQYTEQLLQAEVEALRQQIGPPAQYDSLLDFVQARLDDKAYEKELGLMHRVRRDLDILTDGLVLDEMDDEALKEKKRELFPRGPARVVLFIDDLDRCPPKRVVEVFEAVQLLLSTKLFVVVLGLDTRYVTKALEEAYKHILKAGGDPSGLDYIEKIIQIPYRVRRVGPGGVGRLLTKLMGVLEEEPSSEGAVRQEGVGSVSTVEMKIESDEAGKTEPTTPAKEEQSETLKFLPGDRVDLELCCQQLQLTPRSIKRMVNVLRLLVVYWIRRLGHQYSTEANRPIKRAIIGLLALAAAYPEIMREMFVELDVLYQTAAQTSEKSIGDLLSEFVQKPQLSFLPEWQIERFHSDINALQNMQVEDETGQPVQVSFFSLDLDRLGQDNLNLVRSFSFVGDPTYFSIESNGEPGKTGIAPLG